MSSTTSPNEQQNLQTNGNREWIIDFVAGWVSGAVSILACQPIDTILTRYQATSLNSILMVPTTTSPLQLATATATTTSVIPNGHTIMSNTATATASTVATGNIWRTITIDLYRTSGIRALWRGSSPIIAAAPIQNALLMGGYGYGSRYYTGPDYHIDNSNNNNNSASTTTRSKQLGAIFFGGCTGGVLQSFLMSPVELVKVIQQCTNTTKGYTTYNVTQNILRNSGTSNIMSGLNATLLRDGIPHGVWFLSYDISKVTLMSSTTSVENVPVSVSLASGAIAATVAWMVGYPADLIKTRIQATATMIQHQNSIPLQVQQPLGICDTAKVLITEANGNIINGLYRGFTMKLVRSIPASMIGFTVYEFVKEQMIVNRII